MNVLWTRRSAGDMLGLAARARVLERTGLRGIAGARQVHGTHVALAKRALEGYVVRGEADGQATSIPGLGVVVHVADCVPVALGGTGGVAMLHCGWRGLAGGIIASGVTALRSLGVEGPLQAHLGPGAGACCYEAGPEVHAAFAGRSSRGGNVDLKGEARAQLAELDVDQVADAAICTLCAADVYSHRCGDAARMAGVAWL